MELMEPRWPGYLHFLVAGNRRSFLFAAVILAVDVTIEKAVICKQACI
jgi:hypothetical protein